MKRISTIVIAGVVGAFLSFGIATAVNHATMPSAQARNHQVAQVRSYDDGWDTEGSRFVRHNKRKAVEVAAAIAENMARSGAYADLNDDQFAQLATRVASHIVNSQYGHDDAAPLDP